ncbi:chitin disaccharide deacetylase [Bacillus sp. BRMEA1]|uniref:chitin disaccharide deacetylase n=1 Tax=Neobacillus endophyticus TaxID=2738405 RepID=UPI00156790F4|nr:chitin disaccharide deacetylase [Neobacillus endophyticus]NRD78249.1 chitin disaccharide deacetylase [Neobacillus endophyticus]
MNKLFVNADDFGLTRGVNLGIVDAHKLGIVNSTTMMMNMPGTDHAIQLAKETSTLLLGVHLVLTAGRPLLKDVSSLVDRQGNFKKQSQIRTNNDIHLEDLEREWTAQIEKFLAAGLIPTHLDSHHHMHGIEEFYPVVKTLSERYHLPVRRTNLQMGDLTSFTDLLFVDFYGETLSDDYFDRIAAKVENGQTVEVMCHPGYVDQYLLDHSSYNLARLKELEILTNVKLPGKFELAK